VLLLTALLVVARAAFVVPFSLLHNMWSQDPLSSRDIVIVWWAGLMRGAVSVALVYYYFDDNPKQVLDRGRATLIVSTLMVCVCVLQLCWLACLATTPRGAQLTAAGASCQQELL